VVLAVEGTHASGKTTLTHALAAWYREHGIHVTTVEEPASSPAELAHPLAFLRAEITGKAVAINGIVLVAQEPGGGRALWASCGSSLPRLRDRFVRRKEKPSIPNGAGLWCRVIRTWRRV
jgi:hypothetical protein